MQNMDEYKLCEQAEEIAKNRLGFNHEWEDVGAIYHRERFYLVRGYGEEWESDDKVVNLKLVDATSLIVGVVMDDEFDIKEYIRECSCETEQELLKAIKSEAKLQGKIG